MSFEPNIVDPIARDAFLAENADAYARTALWCVRREYPHLPMVYATDPGPYPAHREVHPAFYGSLDWHSAVEMHWVLARLLRRHPTAIPATDVRDCLTEHLTPANLRAEADFFARGYGRARERPYGWGWLLTLAHELMTWDDPDARKWADAVRPLANVLSANIVDWLPKQSYPIRHGVHQNSAFGLLRAYDYASCRADLGDPALREAIDAAVWRWFLQDADYPARFEPSGSDFLSPALAEAELMSRVLTQAEFGAWLDRFLPDVADGQPPELLEPVTLSDLADGQLAHLAGLNLSRAWSMLALADRLVHGDARVDVLRRAAQRHAVASLRHVVGGDYMVEHWLAAFAVGMLTV
jgi:Protein of unknown function (DUF2891)